MSCMTTTVAGILRGLGVSVLVLGLAGPVLAQAPPPAGPLEDIQASLEQLKAEHEALATQIGNIDTQLGEVATTAEMSAQHDMIKQDVADVETNLTAQHDMIKQDLAVIKELVENGGGGGSEFPCATGTPVGDRWVVSDSGRTVCDKNTNKTWEQHPTSLTRNWEDSIAYCQSLGAGWELPELDILESLVDTNNSDPALPTDHPFDNVQSAFYWSASTHASDPTFAWGVNFGNGNVLDLDKVLGALFAWCVRGD